MSDALDVRAREICAHLLIFPHLPRERYKDLLLDDELRAEVARRLSAVGMNLAESFYSDFFGVRMCEDIEADIRFDWSTNHRLPKGALALLVVLWAKMVLPRRAARDRRTNPDELNMPLFEDDHVPADYIVKIPKEAMIAEYGQRFGRTNVLRWLGQLKRYGFVKEDRAGRLYEGPLLDLMVDGQRMTEEIQAGVLGEALGVSEQEVYDDEPLFDLPAAGEDL